MNRQLRERRDRAAKRHDAALERHPARDGAAFERELNAVVQELSAVATAADDPSSDPVEVAKTYRWLGDACFDRARGTAEAPLALGAQAYQRAETLLADADAPGEKAKLNFNYGNTLRGLSRGEDVALLEAAQARYEMADRGFRSLQLPDFARGRAMLPAEEADSGTDLFGRLVTVEATIRSGPDTLDRDGEARLWRLALDVQRHARRHHLMLARPDFSTAGVHVGPKSLFLSGGADLRRAAEALSARDSYDLLDETPPGDLAEGRWNQLWSASVAVFDVGVPEGSERAQVCYELGLALALGKAIVVTHRPGQALPFDVALQPIPLSNDPEADAGRLERGVLEAIGSIVWGGTQSTLGNGPADALAWLDDGFHRRLAAGSARVPVQLAEQATGDACAFARAIAQLVGLLGADAPAVLYPAWPPAYPPRTGKPRCFHVMPFRPTWATPVRDLASAVCRERGWTYTRGDESEAQRIIPGIWREIATASAVLVDITGHNVNVALELGLAHALGRPYCLVAQGDAAEHLFPSVAKVQVRAYGSKRPYAPLRRHIAAHLHQSAARLDASVERGSR